jgi:hypothetical protein
VNYDVRTFISLKPDDSEGKHTHRMYSCGNIFIREGSGEVKNVSERRESGMSYRCSFYGNYLVRLLLLLFFRAL